MKNKIIKIGAVGCGGFGLFTLEQFKRVPEVEVVAICEINDEVARVATEKLGVPNIKNYDELLSRSDIDLIYISTPPFLHHSQGLKAIQAGKHVICEKPLAVSRDQADEMLKAAQSKGLLFMTNLMQRYNPLFESVKKLVSSKILGEPLHGFFENYACDEQLGPDHWFWDRGKSGGIFIEHGVHFFDLFAGWLGKGKVTAGRRVIRPGTEKGARPIEEQVFCTALYNDLFPVNFYHGFTQCKKMDRQEMRILFERGDITLYEWVPTRVKIDALVNEKDKKALLALFPGSRIESEPLNSGELLACQARHKKFSVTEHVKLYFGENNEKLDIYTGLLRSMIRDQVAWIHDRGHQRVVEESNGRNSLEMAVQATDLANQAERA